MRLLTLLLVLFASTGPAAAGPLEDGLAAFKAKDYTTALRLFRPLADQGDMVAQGLLGVMYHEGLGVPQDYASAEAWSRKSAEQGFADAQFDLGLMYENGDGVPQDHAAAVAWYRKSAEQCNLSAQLNLGVKYANGEAVPQDYVQAYMWFNLAAENAAAKDNPDEKKNRDRALRNRDKVATKMTSAQIAEARKSARECKPASGK